MKSQRSSAAPSATRNAAWRTGSRSSHRSCSTSSRGGREAMPAWRCRRSKTRSRATAAGDDGTRAVAESTLVEALGRARYAYDRQGEDHYNLASALIKSLRNSDASAALYWLARMIEGGADPLFIARRLCILASEDVGLADPQAMVQAAAAAQITHLIGLPEALFPLAQATIYLAQAPKSNRIATAYQAAAADAAASAREPVPLHLRNAVTSLMKSAGYGQGYRYVHDDPDARGEMPCLPEAPRPRLLASRHRRNTPGSSFPATLTPKTGNHLDRGRRPRSSRSARTRVKPGKTSPPSSV